MKFMQNRLLALIGIEQIAIKYAANFCIRRVMKCPLMLAEFDAETRFQLPAARGETPFTTLCPKQHIPDNRPW